LAPALLATLESHAGLTYARYGARELQLDLHRPAARSAPLPAIVCFHGGGWSKGERGNLTLLAQALAARGFVVVTISYRLSGEAKFPAALHDAKAAVRWLRAQAATYGIDPAAIGVTGLTAGGHLAALLATSGGVAALEGEGGHAVHSSAVQAAVAMGAQTDFETDRIPRPLRTPRRSTLRAVPRRPRSRPSRARMRSPRLAITSIAPIRRWRS
jgi:arylsulfatase A